MKMDGFGERRHEEWRWLDQGRETKLTEPYGEDFRAVATPNREKPKKKRKHFNR